MGAAHPARRIQWPQPALVKEDALLFSHRPDPGVVVILVTVGAVGLIVVWVPEFAWFLALALGFGAILAGLIFFLHSRQRPSQLEPGVERLEPAQINFAKLSIGGGLAGLLVVVGSLAAFMIGLEEARWFFSVTLACGVLLAVLLVAWRRKHPGRQTPENTLKRR